MSALSCPLQHLPSYLGFSFQHRTLLPSPKPASIISLIHNWMLFLLWLRPFILSAVISPLISCSILGTYRPGEFLSVSYHFAFTYCSWGSQGKNTEVACYSLLQWTTLCQTSPTMTCPSCVAPQTWLGFTELDKAVVLV